MRNSIRSEILENIPMSILLVPFVAIRYAGDYHVAALVFGVAFFVVYAAVIYGYAGDRYSRLQSYGSDIATSGYRLVDMCVDAGKTGRFFLVIYTIRFLIKAGFAVYVVALMLTEIGIAGFWTAALGFVFICIYGASGNFAKRRVLGNMLMWWMLVPLILLVIFSISRMDYGGILDEFKNMEVSTIVLEKSGNVFGTAWKIVAVMSSFELVLFSFARSRRRQGVDLIRVAVWLIVSVILAYIYVLGMLGSRYVESGSRLSLGNKMDYVLALSWLIGAFFVISSYMFYTKEMIFAISEGCKSLLYGLIFAGTLFFVCCFHYDVLRAFMINWLVYFDVALSLLLPGILIMITGLHSRNKCGR